MKTFLRYAWPVLIVIALQVLAEVVTETKSAVTHILRGVLFFLVDCCMGYAQRYQYKKDLQFKAEMEALRKSARPTKKDS